MTRTEKIGRIMREVQRQDDARRARAQGHSRFVVTTLEGDLEARDKGSPRDRTHGLSCMVVDTIWNRRVIATYRSEDARYAGTQARNVTRRKAEEHAERLNHPTVAACAYCGNPIHPNAWPKACQFCADLPGLEPL